MLKSFIGPFVATFFISMFVLIMQFLWRMIDEIVGKGLEFTVIAELLIYVATTLVPMALPLAVLLSSIMTFGSLGENYELIALKSAGFSLPDYETFDYPDYMPHSIRFCLFEQYPSGGEP